jgi:hypothetical protein
MGAAHQLEIYGPRGGSVEGGKSSRSSGIHDHFLDPYPVLIGFLVLLICFLLCEKGDGFIFISTERARLAPFLLIVHKHLSGAQEQPIHAQDHCV